MFELSPLPYVMDAGLARKDGSMLVYVHLCVMITLVGIHKFQNSQIIFRTAVHFEYKLDLTFGTLNAKVQTLGVITMPVI